ncbi:hypothetical protein [Rhizobacter sp. SG703]|uniref:hypothetical protein n=1 Tax=Rhizobacter sp. SG703 TaxID=2587140 RepID=UPI001444B82D|nr:hypothetical protein [Rhizobacter sp. SG703]NKI93351.1 angiomotin [Rhizobacter sp. SG703]
MSAAAVQAGARERDAFVSMLARLDAQLDRDLASTETETEADDERTDFVPTLQMLKPDEIAALTTAAPRRETTSARAAAARPARSYARLLPWLVGGGLAAGAASFAMSFSGSRPVAPRMPEVATLVPVAPVVSAAAVAPAASAVQVAATGPVPAPESAAVSVATPAVTPPVTPTATVALLQPMPAPSIDSCPPARRALGLCELPAP